MRYDNMDGLGLLSDGRKDRGRERWGGSYGRQCRRREKMQKSKRQLMRGRTRLVMKDKEMRRDFTT